MTLLIDAYNVLHCSHVLPDQYAMISAPRLCQLLDRVDFHRGRMVVVCDGRPKPGEEPGLDIGRAELLYSGPRTDADSVIERLIEIDDAPRDLVVVSNDRRLRRAARRRRGAFLSSEAFLRRLARALHRLAREPAAPEKPAAEDSRDAEEWMRKFGLTDAPHSPSSPPPPHDLESEAEYWMRRFGFDPDENEESD